MKSDLTKEQLHEYYQYYHFEYAKTYARHMFENKDYWTEYKVLFQIEKAENLPIETWFSADERDFLFF